jgi:hypothetical protein
MPCPEYETLSQDVVKAMMSEDMARGSSPAQYPYNSDKKRRETIDRASVGVHHAYQRRNQHINECETCKADERKPEQYDQRGHF